jgi:hypothetical protein
MQVFGLKCLPTSNDKPVRYRFSVTDGIDIANAMASSQLAMRIKQGELTENNVVTLTNYQLNSLEGNGL